MKFSTNQLVGIAAVTVVVIPVGVNIVQSVAYQLTPEAAIDRQLAKEKQAEQEATRQRLDALITTNREKRWKPAPRQEFCNSNSVECEAYNTWKTACLVGVQGACTTAEGMREIYSGVDLSTDSGAYSF